MNVLIIGDIHERLNIVEEIISLVNDYDKIIFIGDYCDSFNHNKSTLIKTLNLLIEFKKAYKNKVVLLLGNHDVHYLFSPKYRATGFQKDSLFEIKHILEDNQHLFDWFYFKNNYLFSHAGVTKGWINEVKKKFNHYDSNLPILSNIFNLSETSQGLDLLCKVGEDRGGKGNSGLLWADKSTLIKDAYFDNDIKYQVVGHTFVELITKIDNLYFTDCLGDKKEYLTLKI